MKLRFLGTGTSAGVPIWGCKCHVCSSTDPRDKRLRTSALIHTDAGERILIDCGPDLRAQIMPLEFKPLDAVLLTHIHYDHVGGLDDLRGFCVFGDINIYCDRKTNLALHRQLPYCFAEKLYPGVPRLRMHEIEVRQPFKVGSTEVMPIEVVHGKVPIVAYRIGERLGYITDYKTISQQDIELMRGVDTLVINALRWERAHHSHALVSDAIEVIRTIGPRKAYLVHLTHNIGRQDEANARLPEGIEFAYDGLEIDI